jgi:uncharacterized protein (UPF0332 family)
MSKHDVEEEYETELRVMAEVRAYFQVAYKVRALLPFTNLGHLSAETANHRHGAVFH